MMFDATPVNGFAADVLASLDPVATNDMVGYINALAQIVQPIEDAVRSTTSVPYGPALNIDETPNWLVSWLGQFVGVQTTTGKTVAQQRDEVRYLGGFKRGTVDTMKAAIRATLTGQQRVVVNERTDGGYGMLVITYASETPDTALTQRVAIASKAAGRFPFTYRTDTGWIISDMETAYAGQTITNLEAGFTSLSNLEGNLP